MSTRDVGRISRYGDEITWMVDDMYRHLTNDRHWKIFSKQFGHANGIWSFVLLKKRSYRHGDAIQLSLTTDLSNFNVCFEVGLRGLPEIVFYPCRKESLTFRPYLMCRPRNLVDHESSYTTFTFFVDFKKVCKCNIVEAPLSTKKDEDKKEDLACHLKEPQASKSKSVIKLLDDLKQLLLSEKDSDVALKVEGREFKAHRLILGTRSPVFSATFQHDMSERQSGVVDIEGCNPDTFNDFLLHLYTGSVELRSENVATLYATADKYQMVELKAECRDYMKNNVSVENFCDFLTLSLQFGETELTDSVTEFFVSKATDIALTAKWQIFMAANSVVANELFLKSLKAKKQ